MTRNGIIFGFCLLLAFILLFFNKLSTKYIGEVKARIHYVHLPAGKVSTAPLPRELTLYVATSGFKLFWAKLLKPINVQINLSELKEPYAVTAEMHSSLASQLSSGYTLIEIMPDTLRFNFERGIAKKVPLIADILISFKKQYDFMEPMLVKPDSVIVSGPENVVDTIKSWKTERLVFEQMDQSAQDEIAMVTPKNPAVAIKPDKARYVIAVEEYTEKTFEAEIKKVNVPGGKEVNIYPNKAKLVFRIGLSNYENVSEESFSVVADFKGVDIKKGNYVSVKVERMPSYIRNLEYSPKSVEYILYH